jgi:hypothetical protein
VGWKADSVAKSRDRNMVVRSSIEKVVSRPKERERERDVLVGICGVWNPSWESR